MFEVRNGQVADCTKFVSNAPQDHGYIVAVLGTATRSPELVAPLADLMEATHPDADTVGSWFNDGWYYVDPGTWVEDKDEALELGRVRGEHSIYGLAERECFKC